MTHEQIEEKITKLELMLEDISSLVKELKEELNSKTEDNVLSNMRISSFFAANCPDYFDDNVKSRALKSLSRNNVLTIGQLTSMTRRDVLRLRGIGHDTLRCIEETLFTEGITLKECI